MSSVLKRIKEIAKQEEISLTALESSIGASKGVFSRALANGTDIHSKWLVNIVENYPQYSAEWLLAGTGEMLKSPVARETTENYTSKSRSRQQEGQDTLNAALRQVIESQEKTIRALEKQIALLENELHNVKR